MLSNLFMVFELQIRSRISEVGIYCVKYFSLKRNHGMFFGSGTNQLGQTFTLGFWTVKEHSIFSIYNFHISVFYFLSLALF